MRQSFLVILYRRGTHQIGGCCTEITCGGERILIDLGANLPDSDVPIQDKGRREYMGKKWGSNADIHIGDIFRCCVVNGLGERPEYYQVVALRGRTQVVLHAIRSETYTNEGIAEDSPLYWRRVRTRPLPGQFMTEDDMWVIYECRKRGKTIRVTGEETTAWVHPCRTVEGGHQLQEIGEFPRRLGIQYTQVFPKDWEPWDAETIRKLEEYDRQCTQAAVKHLNGDEEASWPEYPI